MTNKNVFAALLLLFFLFILNNMGKMSHLKSIHKDNNKCNKNFFIEILKDNDRAKVMSFCRVPVNILQKCHKIENGLSIKILSNGQIICNSISAYKKVSLGIPISINKENIYGLCAVPGIGPYIAKQIIIERHKKGSFDRLDELMTVKGIGNKIYKKILPYIKI